MKKEIQAYSSATKTVYKNWDALLEAEADGYHVIVVATDKRTGKVKFANTTAGGMTKQQARNKAAKFRRDARKELWRKYNYQFFIRPHWNY